MTDEIMPDAEGDECEFCEMTAEYPTMMTPDGKLRYWRCSSCGSYKREERIDARTIHSL